MFLKNLLKKKYLLFGFIIGMAQMVYFVLIGFMTDWVKVSDPIAHTFHFYVILPCSILLFILLTVSGRLYSVANYNRPIKISFLLTIILSALISLFMIFSGTISIIEIFKYTSVFFIILSPFILSIALLIGRN